MPYYPNDIINGSPVINTMLFGYDTPIEGARMVIVNAYFEYEMMIITFAALMIIIYIIFKMSKELWRK
jgi:hypothetical protein